VTFNTIDKALERYEKVVLDAASTLENDLRNKVIYSLKLQLVSVYLGFTSKPQKHTSGLCFKDGDKLHVAIFINPDDPIDYIAFTISHELGHLLYKKLTDVLSMTGKANDGSTEITSIMRITDYSEIYGREMEEQVCDIIACRNIQKMGFVEFSDLLKKELQRTAKKRAAAESFISTFGKRLDECDFIDDYDKNGDTFAVKNSFWYYSVAFGLSQIVNSFDDTMGANAYFKLCEALDINDLTYFKSEVKRFQNIEKKRSSSQ
jgi:hypothetical protein